MRNRFVYIALVLSLIILVWLGRIYMAQHRLQIQYTRDVERTYEVIITLRNCEKLLVSAETNQRGYLLTHYEQFRFPFEAAVSKLDSVFDHLTHVISDNPSQRVNMKLLRPAINERIAILKANQSLFIESQERTERIKKGKLLMDKIYQYIQMMENEEYNLLQFRNKEKFRYQESNYSFLKYIFIFACLVCMAAVLLLIRELRMRVGSQKMLEQSLFELEKSNDEIEQVSFAVSHDLQEPLRKIRTLSTLLTKNHGNGFGPEETDIISRIDRATERMHGLLDNLIDFTNLINRSDEYIQVNLEKAFSIAFDKVMNNMDVHLDMPGPLPVIKGYEQQLVLLFVQILSNSKQFKEKDRKLSIHINSIIRAGATLNKKWKAASNRRYHQITISDNGIGFDDVFHERIFALFQRLHNQGEYNGKGIGLTIARRIMTNHYGFITASGVKGEGATITVYFPAI